MYLSKLEIVGFKSFAQKTVLKFNPGITAIVGPNGCGKSNIIDAIRWVIGEQKASALRSDKMEEVIFNGTGNRKPLGMAEVALTIENTKGILPTEYAEVNLARRLFRSGDSEYLLNKTQCRLRDIVDLFMDTGMGANAYSVIELKMVETILSENTDERRKLFEEAAGVTKYKARRKEALRRLDATKQDLLRVADILKEVSKKVNSLERQAKRAEEFAVLDKEKRELEIEIVKKEYVQTEGRLKPLQEKLNQSLSTRDTLDAELIAKEATLKELENEQAEIENLLLEVQKEVSEIEANIAEFKQKKAVSTERLNSLKNFINRAESEVVENRKKVAKYAEEKEFFSKNIAELKLKLNSVQADYNSANEVVATFESELIESRSIAKQTQANVMQIINSVAQLKGEEMGLNSRKESILRRLSIFNNQKGELLQRKQNAESQYFEIHNTVDEAKKNFKELEADFEKSQETKSKLRAEIDAMRNEIVEVHKQVNTRRSRLEFLAGLIDQDEAVRYLSKDKKWSNLEATTVADVISTDEKYKIAIASLLGNVASCLIVPSIEQALSGVNSLKDSKKGKATFVCLDRISTTPTSQEKESLPDYALGWATQVTNTSQEYNNLKILLLDNSVIVESIENAKKIIQNNIAEKAVTLDGTIVQKSGIVRGGANSNSEGVTIGKKESIDKLSKELDILINKLEKLEFEAAEKSNLEKSIDVSKLAAVVREAAEKLNSIEKKRNQFEYETKSAIEILNTNDSEVAQLIIEQKGLEEAISKIAPQINELHGLQKNAEEKLRESNVMLGTKETEFSEKMRVLNAINIQITELKNEERNAQNATQRLDNDTQTAENLALRLIKDKEFSIKEVDDLNFKLEDYQKNITLFSEELEVVRQKRNEIIALQTQKRQQLLQGSDSLRNERKTFETAISEIHNLELKIQELNQKTENLIDKAREELDINLLDEINNNNAINGLNTGLQRTENFDTEAEQSIQIEGITEQREKLREIKNRIKILGTVNMLAYQEWKEESERFGFINEQYNDLRKSEKTILSTIDEINNIAQKNFLDTFEQIRTNFIDLFGVLFNEGDEADLRLMEGDPLEAKIEIIAKPRGKRPHSIDLLSGGEKTLTAIALLFSIYLVKPSPFCILDEVDAPLDDTNIDRFVNLIRRFVDNTQFIIVTHNKRTMAAADTMYGVTQEESGVSKIVSVQFESKAKKAA